MYNIPCTYVFDSGSLDTDRLINAVKKAVDNHPVMKIFIDNSASAKCSDDTTSLTALNLTFLSYRLTILNRRAKILFKPFDLEKDLFRFAVFECGDKSMFAMDFHHIVSDGICFGYMQ